MEVYHYTRADLWRSMRAQGETGEMKGRMGWTFALPEPEPESWISNPLFPNLWETLMKRVGKIVFPGEVVHTDRIVLLGIEVSIDDPNVFVADRALWEISERGLSDEIAQGRQTGEEAYYESRVPIKDYLRGEEEFSYLLPEVLIGEIIPLTHVKPHTYQPMLEGYIASRSGGNLTTQKWMAKREAEFLELEDWYKEYCNRRPENKMGAQDYLGLCLRKFLH